MLSVLLSTAMVMIANKPRDEISVGTGRSSSAFPRIGITLFCIYTSRLRYFVCSYRRRLSLLMVLPILLRTAPKKTHSSLLRVWHIFELSQVSCASFESHQSSHTECWDDALTSPRPAIQDILRPYLLYHSKTLSPVCTEEWHRETRIMIIFTCTE